MIKLLASSNTLGGITQCIEAYFYGQKMRVENEMVIRCSDNKTLDGLRVILKKGRFRFERILA